MVNAGSHLICGNCGAKDYFTFKHFTASEGSPEGVVLTCGNCITMHILSHNAELKEAKNEAKDSG